jgi:hypothetical protein
LKSTNKGHHNQNAVSRGKLLVKRKRANDVLLRLQTTDKTKASDECNAKIEAMKKDQREMEIRAMLEDRKNMELKSQLETKQLQLKLIQSQLTAKQSHLELAKCNLHVIEEKIMLAANSLAEFNKKVKGQKALARYYDSKAVTYSTITPSETATLENAIEKAFSCLKGKHKEL